MKLSRPCAPRVAALVAVLAASTLLGACAPLIVGGAIVGGSMIAIDRRSSSTQLDDESIELKSVNKVAEVVADRGHVSITSYNHVALITGEVPTDTDRLAVEQGIATISGVRSVVNELLVGPSASLSTRSSDTVLTGRVKAALLDAKDLQSSVFKVVTERGIVYLMGVVTEREAARAADVAREVSGVLKVVRVFQVVSEAELSKARPASGQ